jgi:DNA polymerase I-like protein with 3'-5' exonuclease and polymerase domains
MKSVIAKLDIKPKEKPDNAQKEDTAYCYNVVNENNLKELKNNIKNTQKLYIYYEITSGELFAVSLKIDKNIFIVESSNAETFNSVILSLAENSTKVILHDFKTFIAAACAYADFKNVLFDIYLAAYVLNSADNSYSLDALAKKYLHTDFAVSSNNAQLSFLSENKISYDDICRNTAVVEKLYNLFSASIKEIDCENLYYNIELPLRKCLRKWSARE